VVGMAAAQPRWSQSVTARRRVLRFQIGTSEDRGRDLRSGSVEKATAGERKSGDLVAVTLDE